MISHILKQPQKLEKVVEMAFKTMDTNGNGAIERQELQNMMISMADDLSMEQPSKGEIDEMVRDLAQDKSEILSIKEFRVLVHEVLKVFAKTEEHP